MRAVLALIVLSADGSCAETGRASISKKKARALRDIVNLSESEMISECHREVGCELVFNQDQNAKSAGRASQGWRKPMSGANPFRNRLNRSNAMWPKAEAVTAVTSGVDRAHGDFYQV
jgi:hypothetical protein